MSDPQETVVYTEGSGGGELIANRYQLVALLGRGGMGSVYRARDTALDEVIALKFLARELSDDPALVERFRREVVLARKVTHRNVARTFDIGEHEGARFLTMELVDGESLQSIIARSGPLPPPETLRIARAVLEGLQAAHREGIVHRDLKPDNVMIERSGRIVITDFGVARAATGTAQLTGGAMVGTPAYMAPEQLEGLDQIGPPADIFAFGVMLFQMMTGALPWSTDKGAFALIRERLDNPTPRLDATPFVKCPHLGDLVARLMAEDPAERYSDAAAVRTAIDELPAHNQGDEASRTGAPTRLIENAGPRSVGTTVAVMPFTNRGPADDDYLSEGLTEELIDILSTTAGLRVRPFRDVVRISGDALELEEIGRRLAVEVIAEGTLRRSGGSLRLSARLLSVRDGFQLWARRFSGDADDPFAMVDEVAVGIAEAMTVDLAEVATPPVITPPDAEAADLYFRARHALNQGWFNDMSEALALFEQALERAPRDARILTGAANAYARQVFFDDDDEGAGRAAARARELAQQAIVADPRRGEAHLALGMVSLYRADPVGAVAGLRGALDRTPDLAEAHASLGRVLNEVGPIEEAVKHLEQAQRLDPSLPAPRADLIRPIALRGDWDRVCAALELLDRDEGERALAQMLRARYSLWFDIADPAEDEPTVSELPVSQVRDVYVSVRRTRAVTDAQRELLVTMKARGNRGRRSALFMQMLCEMESYAGNTDRALDALHAAIDDGLFDAMWLERAGVLDPLRDHPRFVEALERVQRRLEPVTRA